MYNKKLQEFYYSQNSINTFKSCPLKFKYKYIDNINWKYDEIESREYYDNLKMGSDFHLVCERYFSEIPLGIEGNYEYDKFNIWLDKIKKLIPINKDYIYLPEYEIRYNKNSIKLQAKYDLIIIKYNEVEIWDWKTEARKLTYKNVEGRTQTILYMFLLKESLKDIFDIDIPCKNITMNYYQPEYEDKQIVIKYNNDSHETYGRKIKLFVDTIRHSDYNVNSLELKNSNHCKYCEFNKLCNNTEINYDNLLEDEIDGA